MRHNKRKLYRTSLSILTLKIMYHYTSVSTFSSCLAVLIQSLSVHLTLLQCSSPNICAVQFICDNKCGPPPKDVSVRWGGSGWRISARHPWAMGTNKLKAGIRVTVTFGLGNVPAAPIWLWFQIQFQFQIWFQFRSGSWSRSISSSISRSNSIFNSRSTSGSDLILLPDLVPDPVLVPIQDLARDQICF